MNKSVPEKFWPKVKSWAGEKLFDEYHHLIPSFRIFREYHLSFSGTCRLAVYSVKSATYTDFRAAYTIWVLNIWHFVNWTYYAGTITGILQALIRSGFMNIRINE
jgi:hypothetical protein